MWASEAGGPDRASTWSRWLGALVLAPCARQPAPRCSRSHPGTQPALARLGALRLGPVRARPPQLRSSRPRSRLGSARLACPGAPPSRSTIDTAPYVRRGKFCCLACRSSPDEFNNLAGEMFMSHLSYESKSMKALRSKYTQLAQNLAHFYPQMSSGLAVVIAIRCAKL